MSTLAKNMHLTPLRIALALAAVGVCQPLWAQATELALAPVAATPLPIEISILGIFRAIGPVRWGILLLSALLFGIAISSIVFLCMPLVQRRDLAASLTSLKEWNTVLSTLCTILGPVGTYIGMIGALIAMHRVAVAVDAATRLAAQAAFFQQAAQMFVSSLAGIGLGISLGLVNSLILHHVLPEHKHPISGQGMIASSVGIVHRWWRHRAGASAPRSFIIPRLMPSRRREADDANQST